MQLSDLLKILYFPQITAAKTGWDVLKAPYEATKGAGEALGSASSPFTVGGGLDPTLGFDEKTLFGGKSLHEDDPFGGKYYSQARQEPVGGQLFPATRHAVPGSELALREEIKKRASVVPQPSTNPEREAVKRLPPAEKDAAVTGSMNASLGGGGGTDWPWDTSTLAHPT